MPREQTVTIRDVARRAGVSIATVSYVLNESAPISEETRARVLATAAELGYRPSAIARGLRAGQSHTLGYSWHHVPRDQWHPILDPFLYSIAQPPSSRATTSSLSPRPSTETPGSPTGN
jgi:transcriptional regulator, LacI family